MSALTKGRDMHGIAIVNSSIKALRAFLIEERSVRMEYNKERKRSLRNTLCKRQGLS